MASNGIAVRGGYPYQFDKEIAKMVIGKYADYPKEYTQIAKIETFPTKGKTYTEAEFTGLGNMRAMAEGEAISFDVPEEGHKKSIQAVKYGLGFQRTEEMDADELFGMMKSVPQSLSRSAAACLETNFWNLFNNGFSTVTAWDGKPVFASNHVTLKSGDTINNAAAADLSATTLQAAFEYFDSVVDENGIKLQIKPSKLVIPTSLKWLAYSLLTATGYVWSYSDWTKGIVSDGVNSHAPATGPFKNQFNPSTGVVDAWSVFVSRYLTDPDAWFLLSDEHDFRFYWKKKPTMSQAPDFKTDNMMYKLVMRFAVGVFDYKAAYGSAGA